MISAQFETQCTLEVWNVYVDMQGRLPPHAILEEWLTWVALAHGVLATPAAFVDARAEHYEAMSAYPLEHAELEEFEF